MPRPPAGGAQMIRPDNREVRSAEPAKAAPAPKSAPNATCRSQRDLVSLGAPCCRHATPPSDPGRIPGVRSSSRRPLVVVWLVVAVGFGALLAVARTSAGPLDDPDPAHQRPGLLDLGELPLPAPPVTEDVPRQGHARWCSSSARPGCRRYVTPSPTLFSTASPTWLWWSPAPSLPVPPRSRSCLTHEATWQRPTGCESRGTEACLWRSPVAVLAATWTWSVLGPLVAVRHEAAKGSDLIKWNRRDPPGLRRYRRSPARSPGPG